MELLTATYCPYCESRLNIESMLTIENLKDMQFYLACPECNKTFSTFAETKVKVDVNSIEDSIEREKDVLLFWEQSERGDEAFKNERIKIRKESIRELEAIKKRNDLEE
jgi:telomere resolvase resT